MKPFCLESVSSTQDYFSEIPDAREGYFVVSKVQTRGRGRQGRRWISDEGGLYLSLELEPNKHVSDRITMMCADAILQTFEESYSLNCRIKEPNDVICNGRKLAGVLVDAVVQGDKTIAHVGIGVNLNNGPAWNEGILQFATSYRLETNTMIDLDEFLVTLLANLEKKYAELGDN